MNAAGLFVFVSVLLFILSLRKRVPDDGGDFIKGTDRETVVEEALAQKKERVSWLARLEEDASKAGIAVPARTLALIAVLGSAAGFTLLTAATGSLVFGLLGLMAGTFLPKQYIGVLKKRRAEAFRGHFGAALSVLSSSLRAGSSLEQALQRGAEDAPSPVREEFARVVQSMKLGLPPEDAVVELRKRVECPEVDVFVVATQILARTGGNMAEIYDLIGQMVSERRAFRQTVRAYTSQARMSASVVSVLPVLVVLFLYLQNPSYFRPLTGSVLGRVIVFCCAGCMVLGWWVIRRMLQVSLD